MDTQQPLNKESIQRGSFKAISWVKVFSTVICLVILVFITFLIGYNFPKTNTSSVNSNTYKIYPTITPSPSLRSGWLTYTSTYFGITIQYPPDLIVTVKDDPAYCQDYPSTNCIPSKYLFIGLPDPNLSNPNVVGVQDSIRINNIVPADVDMGCHQSTITISGQTYNDTECPSDQGHVNALVVEGVKEGKATSPYGNGEYKLDIFTPSNDFFQELKNVVSTIKNIQ